MVLRVRLQIRQINVRHPTDQQFKFVLVEDGDQFRRDDLSEPFEEGPNLTTDPTRHTMLRDQLHVPEREREREREREK